MKATTIEEFRYDLHKIAYRAERGTTTLDDAERLRSISSSLVEIELMLEKMQSRWHNQQETVK